MPTRVASRGKLPNAHGSLAQHHCSICGRWWDHDGCADIGQDTPTLGIQGVCFECRLHSQMNVTWWYAEDPFDVMVREVQDEHNKSL